MTYIREIFELLALDTGLADTDHVSESISKSLEWPY